VGEVDGDPGPLEDHLRPQIASRLGGYGKLERYRIGELRVGGRAEYDVAGWASRRRATRRVDKMHG